MYLAEKTGAFAAGDGQALRSDSVADVSDGRSGADVRPGQLFLSARRKVPFAIERHHEKAIRLYKVLEQTLGQRDYLAGEYSIADIATYPWVGRHDGHNVKLEEFPTLNAVQNDFAAAGGKARDGGSKNVKPFEPIVVGMAVA